MSMAMLGWDLISDERMDELRAIAAVRPLTAADLPESDGMPLDTAEQRLLIDLLTESLETYWADRDDIFITGNQFLYYSFDQVLHRDFLGPDVLIARGVPRGVRPSYVLWQEGKPPDVVIEILSPSTARHDRTGKKRIYQDIIQVPEYFWIDPATGDSAGWRLAAGVYQPIPPDEQGRYWCAMLGLWLAPWHATYRGATAHWLRWADAAGQLLPSADERALAEHERAEGERQRAEGERQRAEAKRQRAEAERQRAEAESARAITAEQRADSAEQRAAAERARAVAAEQELATLRALLAQRPSGDAPAQ